MEDLNPDPAPRLRKPLWERPHGALVTAMVFLAMLLLTLGVTGHWYREYLLREVRAEVEADLSIRGIALTAVMNRRFALLDGLSTYVRTDHGTPNFEARLEAYAEDISSSRVGIRNITIAPDGVVRWVYPLAGNEGVLGYEPRLDARAEVRKDVEETMRTGEIVLTGPVDLIQGGRGLIAREAIFIDGEYWGLVNIILDTEMILTRAGLQPAQAGDLDLALYVVGGDYLLGSADILAKDPASQSILLPGEEWVLTGVPAVGWEAAIRPNMLLFQGLGASIVALLVSLIYLSINRQANLAQAVQLRTAEISEMYAQLQEDLAKRKLAEQALKEQKEQYRSVFELVQDGLFIHDLAGNLVEFNPAAPRLFGYGLEEFRNINPAQYIGPDFEPFFAAYLQAIREGQDYRCQATATRKDGSSMDYEILGSPITYQGSLHALSIVRDITEQVQAYQLLEQRVAERTRDLMALMQISQKLTSTLELEPVLDLILDQLQNIVDYSGASVFTLQDGILSARAYRGPLPKTQVLQARFRLAESVIDQEIYQKLEPVIITDVLSDDPLAAAMRENIGGVAPDSGQFFRSWMGVPLIYKGKYIGNLTFDHQEPNFYHAHHAQLAQAFANQAAIAIENARLYEQVRLLASLQERQKLARELHDSVSQALYGIALGVRTARALLEEASQDDPVKAALEEPLSYTSMLAEAGMAEMRALIFELRPESLEIEGLIAALNKQAAAIQARYHVQVATCLGSEPQIELDAKHALYRIAQEAMHNTVKHAKAGKVFLSLLQENGQLAVIVEDDGIGFDPRQEFPGQLGLHSMRERAERLGGTFAIESHSGEGTKITVTLPLHSIELPAVTEASARPGAEKPAAIS